MSDYLVYIGTYSSGDEDGIHVYRLDMATGALAHQSSIGGIDNPSFLDIAPNRRFLYAIGEVSAVGDRPGGAVAAFAIDQQSGALTHINTESTVGTGPCHISIDRAGQYALAANYGGGSRRNSADPRRRLARRGHGFCPTRRFFGQPRPPGGATRPLDYGRPQQQTRLCSRLGHRQGAHLCH